MMYVTPSVRSDMDSESKPALHISAHKMSSRNWNAEIFRVSSVRSISYGACSAITYIAYMNVWFEILIVSCSTSQNLLITIKPITIQMEERVLWKMLKFAGVGHFKEDCEDMDESLIGSQRFDYIFNMWLMLVVAELLTPPIIHPFQMLSLVNGVSELPNCRYRILCNFFNPDSTGSEKVQIPGWRDINEINNYNFSTNCSKLPQSHWF